MVCWVSGSEREGYDQWRLSEGFHWWPFVNWECVIFLPSRRAKPLQKNIQFFFWHFFYPGLLIFRAVAEPRISSKSAKSREIHKNTRNPAKFARNLTKYMSEKHIWKLSWLLGLLTGCKLANFPWNFVTAASKQHPKTTRRSYTNVAKNWEATM